MEPHSIRTAPDYDVAVEKGNSLDLSVRFRPPQRKMAGEPSETDTMGWLKACSLRS